MTDICIMWFVVQIRFWYKINRILKKKSTVRNSKYTLILSMESVMHNIKNHKVTLHQGIVWTYNNCNILGSSVNICPVLWRIFTEFKFVKSFSFAYLVRFKKTVKHVRF